MNSIYEYLKFCLNSSFITSPTDQVDQIKHFIDKALKQTIYDANVKFKGKAEFNCWEDIFAIIQTDPTIEAILFYRIEREIFINNPDNILLNYLASAMRRRTGCEIYYSTEIGKGFNIQHGFGIVIGPRYVIGENFMIHQGVTLGQKNTNCPDEKITIGNNVTIFANATILGNLKIGNNAKIGANSVLLSDVEPNSIYVGVPAKKVNK